MMWRLQLLLVSLASSASELSEESSGNEIQREGASASALSNDESLQSQAAVSLQEGRGLAPSDTQNFGPPSAEQTRQIREGAGAAEEDRGLPKPWMGDVDGMGRARTLAVMQKLVADHDASKNVVTVGQTGVRMYVTDKTNKLKFGITKMKNDLEQLKERKKAAHDILAQKVNIGLLGGLRSLELEQRAYYDIIKKMAPLKGVRAPSRRFIGSLPRDYKAIMRKAMNLYSIPQKFDKILRMMEDVQVLQRKYVDGINIRQNMYDTAVLENTASLKKIDNRLAVQSKSFGVEVKEKYKPLLKFLDKFNGKLVPKAMKKINKTTAKSAVRANYLGDKSDMRALSAARKAMSSYDRDREDVTKEVNKGVKMTKRQLMKTMRSLDKAIKKSMKGMARVIDLAIRRQGDQLNKPRRLSKAVDRRLTELAANAKEQRLVIRDWRKEFLTELGVQKDEIQAVEDKAVAEAMLPAKSSRGSSLYARKFNYAASRLRQARDRAWGKLDRFKEKETSEIENYAKTLEDANETSNEALLLLKEYEQEERDSVPDPAVVQSREQVAVNQARALRSARSDRLNDRMANITQAMDLERAATAQDAEMYLPKVLDTIDGLQQLTVQPQEDVANFISSTDVHIRNSLPPIFAKRTAFNEKVRMVEREDAKLQKVTQDLKDQARWAELNSVKSLETVANKVPFELSGARNAVKEAVLGGRSELSKVKDSLEEVQKRRAKAQRQVLSRLRKTRVRVMSAVKNEMSKTLAKARQQAEGIAVHDGDASYLTEIPIVSDFLQRAASHTDSMTTQLNVANSSVPPYRNLLEMAATNVNRTTTDASRRAAKGLALVFDSAAGKLQGEGLKYIDAASLANTKSLRDIGQDTELTEKRIAAETEGIARARATIAKQAGADAERSASVAEDLRQLGAGSLEAAAAGDARHQDALQRDAGLAAGLRGYATQATEAVTEVEGGLAPAIRGAEGRLGEAQRGAEGAFAKEERGVHSMQASSSAALETAGRKAALSEGQILKGRDTVLEETGGAVEGLTNAEMDVSSGLEGADVDAPAQESNEAKGMGNRIGAAVEDIGGGAKGAAGMFDIDLDQQAAAQKAATTSAEAGYAAAAKQTEGGAAATGAVAGKAASALESDMQRERAQERRAEEEYRNLQSRLARHGVTLGQQVKQGLPYELKRHVEGTSTELRWEMAQMLQLVLRLSQFLVKDVDDGQARAEAQWAKVQEGAQEVEKVWGGEHIVKLRALADQDREVSHYNSTLHDTMEYVHNWAHKTEAFRKEVEKGFASIGRDFKSELTEITNLTKDILNAVHDTEHGRSAAAEQLLRNAEKDEESIVDNEATGLTAEISAAAATQKAQEKQDEEQEQQLNASATNPHLVDAEYELEDEGHNIKGELGQGLQKAGEFVKHVKEEEESKKAEQEQLNKDALGQLQALGNKVSDSSLAELGSGGSVHAELQRRHAALRERVLALEREPAFRGSVAD